MVEGANEHNVPARRVVHVTREQWREHTRQERERRAEEKRARLLEACRMAREAAEQEDAWMDSVERAPIYSPTEAEWADPLAYIRSIQAEASQYGICIVRAPVAPTTPGGLCMALQDPAFKFDTRQQAVRDSPWEDFSGGVTFQYGKRYSLREFQDAACAAAAKRFGGLHGCLPPRFIEREYWRERERRDGPPLVVEYGNDVDGSLFLEQDRLGASRWNLNSLPLEPGSALRHCGRPIAGVSTPMLYVGQLFSTFAWHVEDHFIFSINYQHLGASKTWYGVPASDADGFERVARDSVYAEAVAKLVQAGASEAEVWGQVERALMGKTTMFSPRLLVEAGVRVCRAVQAVGDYVLTFPRAYHAGFGNGFQVGEAVNFGMGDWWPFGEDARQRYRRLRHPAILPQEQVLCDEALQLAERRRREAAQQAEQRHEKAAHKPYCSPAGLVPSPPATPPPTEASGCAALAHTFVGAMRRLNHCRGALEAAGAVPLLACPHGSPEAALSLHCAECQQLCYVATAVLQPAGEPASWRHLCLECAAASLPSTPAATAETGLPASVPQPHGGVEVAAALPPLLFVKPCWADLEECARQLEREGVPDLSTLPLTLPLCGTTEQERYGRRHDPGWPSASQPYAWQPLLKLHERLPGSVRPAAPAPAQAAGEAGEGASQLLPQRAAQQLSALQAFHVAVKSEEGEGAAHAAARSRPDTTQRQQHAFAGAPAEAAEAGITTKPAASQQLQQQPCPKAPSLPAEQQQADRHQEAPAEGEEVTCLQQRQDVQQGPQQAQQRQPEASQETGAGREAKRPPRRRDSSGPLLSSLQEPLPVAANGAVLVAGQRVQRQAWRDTTGECVLLATAVLEAMGRRDPREASTRTMGTMLRRAGAGAVPRAFLSGVGHGARAVVNQQHVGHLLAWHELQEGERAALRQYVAGVWPTWPAELGHDEDTPATANQLGSLSAGFSEEQLQQQLMEEEQQGEEEQQQQKGPSPASRWKPSPVPQQRQLKQLQQLQPPEQAQHDYDQHEDEAPAAKRQRPRIPQASASTDGKSRAATAVLKQALRGGYNDQMTPQVGGERREDGGRASRPVQQQESLQRATAVSVGATASMRPVCSGGATTSASQHSGAAEGAPADSQLQSPATTSATTATASLGARMEAQPPTALLVPSSALAGRTEPRKSQNIGGPAGPRPELAGAAKALRWDQQAGQARLQAAAAAAEALHRHRLQKEQQLSLALQQQQGLEAELARMRQAKQLQQQAALRRQQEVEQQRRMVQEHQLQQQARQRPTRQGSQPWGPGGLSGSSSGPVPTPKESATPLDAPIMSLPYPSDEVDEILFMLGAQSPLVESPVGGSGAPAAPEQHASASAGARAEPASALPPGWPGLKGSLGESTRPASRGGAAAMRVAGGRAGSIPSAALIPPLPDSAAVLGPQRAQQHLRQQPSGTDASKSNRRQAAGGQLPDAGGGVGQGSADLGLGGSLRGLNAGLAGRSSAAARAAPSWPLQSDADLQRCVAAAIAGDREARAASARYMQQSGGVQRLLKLGLPVDLVAWLATP